MNSSLLQQGESINGFIIIKRLPVQSSESEIYIADKEQTNYIVKYYTKENYIDTDILNLLKQGIKKNIVSLIDSGVYGNRHYEVFEYIDGGSLGDKDSNDKYKYLPLQKNELVKIIKQLNDGINEIHNLGIIHRDIKPENILYSLNDSHVSICDFGISSKMSNGTDLCKTNTRARTEGYVGPEIYSYQIGPKTDYYSLGITAWRLGTGKDPFVHDNCEDMTKEEIQKITIDGSVTKLLFKRSKSFDIELRKLIKYLLISDYNKRWGYDEVLRFCNRKNW